MNMLCVVSNPEYICVLILNTVPSNAQLKKINGSQQ